MTGHGTPRNLDCESPGLLTEVGPAVTEGVASLICSVPATLTAHRAISQVRWPALTRPPGVARDGQNAGSSRLKEASPSSLTPSPRPQGAGDRVPWGSRSSVNVRYCSGRATPSTGPGHVVPGRHKETLSGAPASIAFASPGGSPSHNHPAHLRVIVCPSCVVKPEARSAFRIPGHMCGPGW